MRIIVCAKEVPDTEAYIRIGEDQKSINESNVTFIMNPYDEFAVEEALKIKDGNGASTMAICIGSERANEVLRTAMAMGIDDAIRIKNGEMILDGLTIAKALASVLRVMEFDLLLLGKEAVDDGNMQVGPMLGELLDVPCVTVVTKLSVENDKVIAEREVEGGTEIIESSLPCIITAQKGLNEPRYPSLRGKMMAKKKIIDEREVSMEKQNIELLSMQYPPSRGEAKVVGEGVEAVPELVRLLREEAKVI